MFSYPCFRFQQFPDMYISFMAGQLVSAAVESEADSEIEILI